MSEKLKKQLIQLSHELGREERALAILGEGNTSVKLENGNFLVKASGSCLGTLSDDGITECNVSNILDLFNQSELSDLEVDKALLDSRVVAESKKPSVEATFHGYLLSLPGVKFVGHTHPIHVNKLLCSGNGRDFAERRIFPDQIVCCGAESVFVPYVDPGLELAKAIKEQVEFFIGRTSRAPVTILIENHGLICIGKTWQGVLAASLMANKSAEILAGALACGNGSANYLANDQVDRIAGRPDEHYRQKVLNL
jgi:rhamnose utilization protein RhaD (predicted bifunctional aldolase and dehydrogenase)|tara:strand:+ start:408 stop:1169 length:762 start_codon:yes stop_codon:yes gene_type:complete